MGRRHGLGSKIIHDGLVLGQVPGGTKARRWAQAYQVPTAFWCFPSATHLIHNQHEYLHLGGYNPDAQGGKEK